MSQSFYLLLLFVVLPFVVAAGVIWFVSWRSSGGPPPVRTSDILATGERGTAEILAVKNMATFLDRMPMMRVDLRITLSDEMFELQVTQAIPHSHVRDIVEGNVTEVRVTPDRNHAAIVLRIEE